MSKILIEPTSGLSHDQVAFISNFCLKCEQSLGLDTGSHGITLTGDKVKHNIATTAHFSPGDNAVVVFTNGRHEVDIIRSIAHELVHMQQAENDFYGLDINTVPDVGGQLEDEANAVAGQLVKLFLLGQPKSAG